MRRIASLRLEVRAFAGLVSLDPVPNVFHVAVQRTGSQWIRQIWSDTAIAHYTGLATFPQFDYERGHERLRFPRGTYVPGLYIGYDHYCRIVQPPESRTFRVVRNPRDVAVSWYWSAKESHAMMGDLAVHRPILRSLDFQEGLAYAIRALSPQWAALESWNSAPQREDVLLVRFEDLVEDPETGFGEIFRHCGFDIPAEIVSSAISHYSKEKMRDRDLRRRRRREGQESHYRSRASSADEAFSDQHHLLFREVAGDLTERMGYG